LLTTYYGDRHFALFAALETIARVPYFSYTSVLHLFETLGWFRQKDYIKLHFAESWNELHHLLIMESLGGSDLFMDRFLAQHIAFFYYWLMVFLYITAPAVAYNLMMHIERHAFDTYFHFLQTHEEELRKRPAPAVAVEYYERGDLSLFDSFHRRHALQGQIPTPSPHINSILMPY
jgi:ubiquinol oxidase